MTPAINLVKKNNIPHSVHEYLHDSGATSYGEEAARCLGISPARVYKTLVVALDGKELAVGIVPVSEMLSTKAIAKILGARKAVMANKQDVARSTGYVLGGVSPLGQKKRLRTVIDSSAKDLPSMFVSAGRRGLEIEIAADDLASLCAGQFGDIVHA